jgi:hypothetical protein
MRHELIDRGIFLTPSGYWWAWSFTREDRASSLRTKNQAVAQAKYDRQLRELREALASPARETE